MRVHIEFEVFCFLVFGRGTGQITIPVEIRNALKVSAGGEFVFKSVWSTSASALKCMFGAAETCVSAMVHRDFGGRGCELFGQR